MRSLRLALLAPALALAGPSARDWAELGLEKARAGLHAEAVTALRRSLDMDPGDARAWNNLGASLGKLGRAPEEIAAYRKAWNGSPNWMRPGATSTRRREAPGTPSTLSRS